MNTRLPDLLHDLASEMPTETRTPARHTLRRARTRRAVVVAFTGATVVAVALGTLGGLRALSSSDPTERPVVPATDAPLPEGFRGMWPETSAQALVQTQAQVDEGHQPLRLDASQTAVMLATNLFGWTYESVQVTTSAHSDAGVRVDLRNSELSPDVPPITVDLAQLGRTGPDGIWSVVDVRSGLFSAIGTSAPNEPGPDPVIQVTGTVNRPSDGDRVRYELFAGPYELFPSAASRGFLDVDGDRFEGSITVRAVRSVLWLHLVDDAGITLGAQATSVILSDESPVPSPSPDFTDLPPDVAVTAQLVYDGARARDLDALAELLDPNTFAYNFDDGSDPIPAWREDPSDLDLAAAILQLPAAEPREIEGYGTFYLWPYLIDSDFANLSDQERADLRFLGYSDEEIQLMIDGGYGYQGARLGIDAEGLWRNFTTVGE